MNDSNSKRIMKVMSMTATFIALNLVPVEEVDGDDEDAKSSRDGVAADTIV